MLMETSDGDVQRISTNPLRKPDETDMFKGGRGKAGSLCSRMVGSLSLGLGIYRTPPLRIRSVLRHDNDLATVSDLNLLDLVRGDPYLLEKGRR